MLLGLGFRVFYGYIGVILGQNGNYYLGFRVWGLEFKVEGLGVRV